MSASEHETDVPPERSSTDEGVITDDVVGDPVDPVDVEAAQVDARSPEAVEQIEELAGEADAASSADANEE